MNLSNAPNGKTLTNRMQKAIQMARRLRWLPISQEQKEHIVLANVLLAGLYGVEASHVNQSTLSSLRSAISNVIGPRSARASNDVTVNNTSCAADLDPNTYILTQRVLGLRRTLVKNPHKLKCISETIARYNNSNQPHADPHYPMGPIGFLVSNLNQIGARLDEDLVIHKQGEATIDIQHMPWQHLKKATTDLASRHRMEIASETRAHLSQVGEIDDQITKKIINNLGAKEKRIYRHISSGAAWAEGHLHEIGLSEGRCTHCGAEAQDISHVCWDCPSVNKHRKNTELKDLDPSILPNFIKHGVPKAMSLDVEATFWGDKPQQGEMQNCGKEAIHAIGLHTSNKYQTRASCKNQEVKDLMGKNSLNTSTHNARQAFQKIKANKQKPHLPLPYRCHRPPPKDINVYSDGSWINPLQQYLGLGGAGVWWPGRNPKDHHRLSPAELDLAHYQQYDDGLMLYTPIGGYTGSSTRTELAAAIIALSANGPIHLGTDSQAFLDKAEWILECLRSRKPHKVRWGTTPDGDLWHHFEQAAKAKGPSSIRITKVKGHITQQQVLNNTHRACDKAGNDKADQAADVAVKLHGDDVTSVARILHTRHRFYTKFMHLVTKHIVEGFLIHRRLFELEENAKPKESNKVTYTPTTHYQPTDPGSITHFNLQGTIDGYKGFRNKHVSSRGVWQFLNEISFVPCQDQHKATTWLELYIAYRCMGFEKPIPDKARQSRARATVEMQLREFKATVRGVRQRGNYNLLHSNFLKPIKVTHSRFKGLGVKGKYQAPGIALILSEQIHRQIEDHLIRLGHPLSNVQITNFRDGQVTLEPNLPNLKGRVGWDSKLTGNSQMCGTRAGQVPTSINTHTQQQHSPICLECPLCKASALSNGGKFQREELDTHNKCTSCKATSKIRDWMCSCQQPWHLCNVHQSCATHKAKILPSSKPCKGVKRPLGPFTQEQLTEIDAKRIRKAPAIIRPPTANMLSVHLRERFAHLLT